ncbi:MAG TPA: 2-succinyl-5-enolpyruvyl-6-hydroxy-3-cyclohexene-1-carboxylic-acid synthase [Jiangellales bacterium]|nr:2-succinyl-5-enolpyruvyl-6-hydroxy-3-cyclohexene-1-carboxylic-acid synthase [Jiangellales bacterium]
MNPSTAVATVLVDELVRGGVREAVLAPGSRSAPVAIALHAADAASSLRLHVRVDERSAAFLALGLARASGRPVAVLTTSGTAASNAHPAVLEASYGGVPLVVLTADRPPELRETGANQAVDQVGLYGSAVRFSHDVGVPEERPGQVAYWRALVGRALVAARGALGGGPGPVHLNLPLREPLLPDGPGSPGWPEPLDGRAEGEPWVSVGDTVTPGGVEVDDADRPTVVVAGAGDEGVGARLGADLGWPVLAEPVSGSFVPPVAVPAAPLVLGVGDWVADHRPGRVVVTGRPTLSRTVLRVLAAESIEVWAVAGARYPDPGRSVARVVPGLMLSGGARAPDAWLAAWVSAGEAALRAVGEVLDAHGGPTGPGVARSVLAGLPDGASLVVGASQPVRDLHLAARPRTGVSPYGNRGVSGIDGTVSTAVGVALARPGPTYALMGDLTFLHDANGLVVGPGEPRPDLTVVVVNDDGGGIFTLLEQGAPEHAGAFERVFGTPHGVDLAALCLATGTGHVRVADLAGLVAELGRPEGVRVVEVRVDRSAHRDLHARLRSATAAALGADPA